MNNWKNKQTDYFFREELAIKVIMDCRTKAAHKFRTRSGFKQYDVNQRTINANNIDLYFYDYKLAIEIDDSSHYDINNGYKIDRQKDMEEFLVVSLLGLILIKKTLIFIKLSMKYLEISNNSLKKH